jgi:hypothetical protein
MPLKPPPEQMPLHCRSLLQCSFVDHKIYFASAWVLLTSEAVIYLSLYFGKRLFNGTRDPGGEHDVETRRDVAQGGSQATINLHIKPSQTRLLSTVTRSH